MAKSGDEELAVDTVIRSQRGEFPSGFASRTTNDAWRLLTRSTQNSLTGCTASGQRWTSSNKLAAFSRGMAAVVHELWERSDANLLIMPATVPIDAPQVSSELSRYVEEGWTLVIESDVDGPNALPLRLDRENVPTLGRYSAARRVARTIYPGWPLLSRLPTGVSMIGP